MLGRREGREGRKYISASQVRERVRGKRKGRGGKGGGELDFIDLIY